MPRLFDDARWNALDCEVQFANLAGRGQLLDIVRPNGIGIELGVASGRFSETLLKSGRLTYLYGVDLWGDGHHGVDQYRRAINRLAPYRMSNSLLRMSFTEAAALFHDEYFDFIYVDGFARGGEEDGRTFNEWFPKVRKGGVFTGHDYDPHWPRVIKAVDRERAPASHHCRGRRR